MGSTHERSPSQDFGTDEAGAFLWLVTGLVLMVAYLFAYSTVSREVAVAGMILCGMVAVWRLRRRRAEDSKRGRPLTITAAAAAVATLGTLVNLQYAARGLHPAVFAVAAVLACALVLASALNRSAGSKTVVTPALLVIVANFVLTVLYLQGHPARIDVEVVLREGVGQILGGHNPYAMTFTNPYTPEESRLYYAPGILINNRISLGFPYPPIVLLLALPGYLLGDVRLSGLIMITLLALAVHGRGSSRVRRSQALAFVTAPGLLFVLSNAWTETLSAALLGIGLTAGRRASAVFAATLLGAFVVSKQYLVVVLPALWMLRAHIWRAPAVAFCITGAVLTVPWFWADPSAMWRALSGAHEGGLVRPDSISLLVQGVLEWGWGESPWYRWLPVGVGVVVSLALAVRLQSGGRGFAVAMGVSLMATVLVSKQSFFNYYYLISMCFAIAGVLGPHMRCPESILESVSAEVPPKRLLGNLRADPGC